MLPQADASPDAPLAPGRNCPIAYRYAPEVFRSGPAFAADVLYVAGGLYGNPFALDALLERASRERARPRIVFNGDFHWFDARPEAFAAIQRRVMEHVALRGNVETELALSDSSAGCGCGYPDWVGDAEVDRSNQIIARLREAAASHPALRDSLGSLSMHQVAMVGDARIGIVHGDCWSLAGWRFCQETLEREATAIGAAFDEAGVDVFASSHTCLPVAHVFRTGRGGRALVNNGAAGMPNFRRSTFGVFTRIAMDTAPDALYRARLRDVVIEALPIRYDAASWAAHFSQVWPAASPASISYERRIRQGPDYGLAQAIREGFAPV